MICLLPEFRIILWIWSACSHRLWTTSELALSNKTLQYWHWKYTCWSPLTAAAVSPIVEIDLGSSKTQKKGPVVIKNYGTYGTLQVFRFDLMVDSNYCSRNIWSASMASQVCSGATVTVNFIVIPSTKVKKEARASKLKLRKLDKNITVENNAHLSSSHQFNLFADVYCLRAVALLYESHSL